MRLTRLELQVYANAAAGHCRPLPRTLAEGPEPQFFLGKLAIALRRALEGIAFTKIGRPGDRMIVELGEGAPVAEALARLARVSGISSYAVARTISRRPEAALEAICDAAWQEVEPEKFA